VDDDFDDYGSPRVRLGDTPYELVLPSGNRIGHRALRNVYKQNLTPYILDGESTTPSKSLLKSLALERRRDAEKGALIPARGAGLGKGAGEVVKARNRGEARQANRGVREFWDVKRQEQFKSRVAMKSGNNQKHVSILLLASSEPYVRMMMLTMPMYIVPGPSVAVGIDSVAYLAPLAPVAISAFVSHSHCYPEHARNKTKLGYGSRPSGQCFKSCLKEIPWTEWPKEANS
jgi:hypothetical protein